MTKRARLLSRRQPRSSIVESSLAALTTASLAAAGSWILYSSFFIDHQIPLNEALPADRVVFPSRSTGYLSYYHNRSESGRPLVLIHSVNAAASAYEMRPLFMRYTQQRPVLALDLPGFGFSERSKRAYTPELYETAMIEFLETQLEEPADVVALSLGCEFAARAALERPDLFNSLVLISPTGFNLQSSGRASQQAGRSGLGDMLHPAFSFPLWGRPLFDLIATRKSITYFLQKSFMGPPHEDLIDYAYATAHQPGAEHAPLTFISGKLFTPGVRARIYEQVKTPTLVLYDRDYFTSFEMLPDLLAKNAAWQAARVVPTMGLPHFERLEETTAALDKFWQ